MLNHHPPSSGRPSLHSETKRSRMNLGAISLNIILPWLLFMVVFGVLSFEFHHHYPAWAWFIVALCVLVVMISGAIAVANKRKRREAAWFTFATVAFAVAVLLGVIFGDLNFQFNTSPFYDVNNLQVYEDVNPATDHGKAFMDAGKVYFSPGTKLDGLKSVGFKNGDIFCVAPIVNGQMKHYDFWAVGVNCCADRADFRCGEYANERAKNGLRLMHDVDRPFYRLAVQEAEAVYGITSPHPLFFYWMQDPLGEQNAYRDDGYKYFLIGIFTHFAFNLICVLCAVVGFSKMGRHSDTWQ